MSKINKTTGKVVAERTRNFTNLTLFKDSQGVQSVSFTAHCAGGVKKDKDAEQELYDITLKGSYSLTQFGKMAINSMVIALQECYKRGSLPEFVKAKAVINANEALANKGKGNTEKAVLDAKYQIAYEMFMEGLPASMIAKVTKLDITDAIMQGFEKIKASAITDNNDVPSEDTEGLND